MVQSQGISAGGAEAVGSLADHLGLAIHPLDDSVVDLQANGIEDALFMSAQHPGKVPQRFQSTVRRPPRTIV